MKWMEWEWTWMTTWLKCNKALFTCIFPFKIKPIKNFEIMNLNAWWTNDLMTYEWILKKMWVTQDLDESTRPWHGLRQWNLHRWINGQNHGWDMNKYEQAMNKLWTNHELCHARNNEMIKWIAMTCYDIRELVQPWKWSWTDAHNQEKDEHVRLWNQCQ